MKYVIKKCNIKQKVVKPSVLAPIQPPKEEVVEPVKDDSSKDASSQLV